MRIETATPEDRDAVVRLWQAAGLTRPWNDPAADYDRALAATSATVLVARGPDGAPIGSVMAGGDGHRGWLYYLAVDGPQRGRGLGRALVDAAEVFLADAGLPKAMLMVRTGNPVGSFYEAMGYVVEPVTVYGRRWDT